MVKRTKNEAVELMERGRADYCWYMTHALDVNKAHIWSKMQEMCDSVRDNERTSVGAGHGVSKTYSLGRIALCFLMNYYPSTVITTAPTGQQVKNLLWREIRQAHSNARMPLGGKLTTTMLDMQQETGVKWFATGFSTKPDTVTQEATAFQGYHNDHVLIIFDEAAGILPEIWRAAEHIGAPFKRFVAVGNVTSAGGDFPESLRDSSFNHIRISVKDTPNFKQGKNVIPGVYGRDYEKRIRLKYGEDSDQYRVRVEGMTSGKRAEGSYYGRKIEILRQKGRITNIEHNPNYAVFVVEDPGYTTALWFFQLIGQNVCFLRYYEDSGLGIESYARLFDEFRRDNGYHYGKILVPCDMDSNATKVVTGESSLETLRNLGFMAEALPMERSVVNEGVPRTLKFLDQCWFDETNCKRGIECLEQYHERKNKQMSTEDNPIFTGIQEKNCWSVHGADAFRYASMAVTMNKCNIEPVMSKAEYQELKRKYA